MCGIAGFHIKERYRGQLPVDEMLDYLLLHIQSRGEDATGFASVNFGGVQAILNKKDLKAEDFIQQRLALPRDVQTVIGHTRFATQGRPEDNENNHPVLYGTCFATHNGHIGNDDEIVRTLPDGVMRPAAVDSIAIPIALSTCGMDSVDNIKKGLESLRGGMAVSVFDLEHPGQTLLAKGESSPLYLLNHKYGYFWASTRDALDFMWGVLIGTPPNRKAKSPEDLGQYEFKWGEAVLLNGDALERFEFTPKVRYLGYSGSTWTPKAGYTSRTGGSFRSNWDWEDDQYGWDDTYTADLDPDGKSRIKRRVLTAEYTKTVRYTCDPSAAACSTPCPNGCMRHGCTCTETVYEFKADYNGDPTDIDGVAEAHAALDYQEMLATQSDPSYDVRDFSTEDDRAAAMGLIKCAGCNDWTAIEDMEIYDDVLGGDYMLCEYCVASWGGPLPTATVAVREDIESAPDEEKVNVVQALYEEDEVRHKYALFNCADAMDMNEQYVEWLLFKSNMDEISRVPAMEKERDLVDELYTHYYHGMEAL